MEYDSVMHMLALEKKKMKTLGEKESAMCAALAMKGPQ